MFYQVKNNMAASGQAEKSVTSDSRKRPKSSRPTYENVEILFLPSRQSESIRRDRGLYENVSILAPAPAPPGEDGGSVAPPSVQIVNDKSKAEETNGANDDEEFDDDSDFDDVDILEDGLSLCSSSTGLSISSSGSFEDEDDMDPLYCVVRELYLSEKAYVERLHLLVRVFLVNVKILNKVQTTHVLPPGVLKQICSNLDVLYEFHASSLLPALEVRLQQWKQRKGIGDLMSTVVPFLKLYTEYVANVDTTIKAIDHWSIKSPILAQLVDEIQRLPECRRQSLTNHLLDIANRVPIYLVTLKDYLSCSPEGVKDRTSAEGALQIVITINNELDKAMGKDARLKVLWEVQRKLDGDVKIVKTTRELIKEGTVQTISPKTGAKRDRHIFLFNDIMLLCTSAGFSGKHKIKLTLEMQGLKVTESRNLEMANTFCVRNRKQAIEFCVTSLEARDDWLKSFERAIDEFTTWKLSGQPMPMKNVNTEEEVGSEAPTLVHLSAASMCMLCGGSFGALKKKHHCKACGTVVCSKCCTQRAPLDYDNMRTGRVCDDCYITIRRRCMDETKQKYSAKNVKATDASELSGVLHMSANNGGSWDKRWFALHEEGTLYTFKANQDIAPLTSLLIEGCQVSMTTNTDRVNKPNVFKVKSGNKVYYFRSEGAADAKRWVDGIAKAAGGCQAEANLKSGH